MKNTLSFGLLIFAFLIGCASEEKYDTSAPEGMYKLGEKYEKDERYEEALSILGQLKNKHPYSKYAAEAELKMADIQFKREEYVEAQAAYQSFKELRPSHPRIDYVTFRLGLSFFKQLPATIDRDLSVADRAILYFDEVTQSFATSPYAAEAKANRAKALKMLADKELYIANFYFLRKRWESALGRFEDLLKKYPDSGLEAKALYGAAVSAFRMKEIPKAKSYYRQLTSDYSRSSEAAQARSEIGNL